MAGAGPWAAQRVRAEALRERYPFAAEVLGLYLALLDGWQAADDDARAEPPEPARLAAWAVDRTVPAVVKATEAAGPESLATAVRELVEAGRAEAILGAWLGDGELSPVERYLARAALTAPLVSLGDRAGQACAPGPGGERACPNCGGLPQLSVRDPGGDPLVSGPRRLVCSRCGQTWSYSASACPACGETTGAKRTIYAERADAPVVGHPEPSGAPADGATFPQLRIEACASCERYLIEVDLGRDPRAVPEVDELAALPLALYATEAGLTKITPNLMGL